MSEVKQSPTSSTKSEGSPTHSVRVVNGEAADDSSIEVKVGLGGDNKVKVEVSKIEAMSKGQNEEATNGPDVEPLTDEEIEQIISQHARMSKEELDKYMDFFWSVDTFRFGAFTVHQLAYRLRGAGHLLTNKQIAKMFSDLDKNNDLLVSLDEYLEEMSKPSPRPRSKEELRAWFNKFDVDQDGYVNRKDVRSAMDGLGATILTPQLDELMRNDSSGKNERLSFEDFCVAIARMK